jgi:hypothetical protein
MTHKSDTMSIINFRAAYKHQNTQTYAMSIIIDKETRPVPRRVDKLLILARRRWP